MDHDGEPSGSPAVTAATWPTPSVATRLSAHTAKCKWVLYAADRFVAQCHKVTCETCNGYVGHLINGVCQGSSPSSSGQTHIVRLDPHHLAGPTGPYWPLSYFLHGLSYVLFL